MFLYFSRGPETQKPKLRNLPPIDDFVANAPSWANGPALYGVN